MPNWLPVLIVLLPLAAAILVVRCPWSRPGLAHGVAALALGADFVLALWMAVVVVPGGVGVQGPHVAWADLSAFVLGVGVYVDPMAAIMAVIVCLLGTLVLLFNAWYMHDDALATRFPWQFCLFVAAMLGVVLADNLFLAFVCWELVGLGSYLLIGFWYAKPAASEDPEYQRLKGAGARGVLEHRLSPAHAQLKAFVMNRVGDAGFLLGIGALLAAALASGRSAPEPLTWTNLFALAQGGTLPGTFLGLSGQTLLVLAALGIFCGAVGKSAQFPLHPWLPDAMQGPTTASSIIHAATMVAAGVYLVARTYPLFPQEALAVVGWTGGITCLLAAAIACVQWDLKAVLAYSTVSQLGLMFVALGAGEAAGGRAAGIAHLFTHAFFKCLLFLGAGAVIHASGGCQDLQRLGGLRKKMPITAAACLAGVLAILGTPFFSGFYSKDGVLAAALAGAAESGRSHGPLLLAAAGSLLTAAYMLRWWLRIFAGEARVPAVTGHAHDPAWTAKIALLLLVPFTLSLPWMWRSWLDGALAAPHAEGLHAAHTQATQLALGLLLGGGGFALVVFWWLPRRGIDAATALAARLQALHNACAELFGIDRLWDLLFVRGLGAGLARVSARVDLGSPARLEGLEAPGGAPPELDSLDGVLDGLGQGCAQLGRGGAWFHAGRLSTYVAGAALLGAVLLLWGLLG